MSNSNKETWDYAALSKLAKQLGGPGKLIEVIKNNSRKKGRMDMMPAIGITAIGTYALTKAIEYFKKKSEISDAEIEKASEEITRGIQEYDEWEKNRALEQTTKQPINLVEWQGVDKSVVVHFTDGDYIVGEIASIDDEDDSGLGEEGITIFAIDGRIVGIGQSEIERIEVAQKDVIRLQRRLGFIRRELGMKYCQSVINNKTRFRVSDDLYIDVVADLDSLSIMVGYAQNKGDAEKEKFMFGNRYGVDIHPMTMLKQISSEIEESMVEQ